MRRRRSGDLDAAVEAPAMAATVAVVGEERIPARPRDVRRVARRHPGFRAVIVHELDSIQMLPSAARYRPISLRSACWISFLRESAIAPASRTISPAGP